MNSEEKETLSSFHQLAINLKGQIEFPQKFKN
jgi:hypothetical protein